MFKEIKIGEKSVEMLANGATAYRYKQVFNEDLLPFFTGKKTPEEQTIMVQQLAFVMAKQAEKADFTKINVEGYLAWSEDFEATDLMGAEIVSEILGIYSANQKTNSVPKKNKG